MKKQLFLILSLTAIAMPIIGYSADDIATNNNQAVKQEKKPLYWVDTMEPDVHYPGPGKSRMGMKLVPVYPKDSDK